MKEAALLDEEKRDEEEREECRRRAGKMEAAQTKVRVRSNHRPISVKSSAVQLGGERCGVSVARVSACPLPMEPVGSPARWRGPSLQIQPAPDADRQC